MKKGEREEKRKGEKRREDKRNKQKEEEDAMVFGDNVRARRAARALPRTPTQDRKRKRKKKEEEDGEDKAHNDETTHAFTPSPFLNTMTDRR